ncbi:MAG: hypothetical protein Q4F30_06195 [Akkermansia sp.]|nr:hypothetical protein [Akkermansia sp.]
MCDWIFILLMVAFLIPCIVEMLWGAIEPIIRYFSEKGGRK